MIFFAIVTIEIYMNWVEKVLDNLNASKEHVADININNWSIKYSSKIKLHRDIRTISGDDELVRAHLIIRLYFLNFING